MHAHLAGNVGEDGVTILEFHLEHRVGQGFEHRALEFDYIFLSQKLLLQNGLIKQQRKIVPKRQEDLKKKSHMHIFSHIICFSYLLSFLFKEIILLKSSSLIIKAHITIIMKHETVT